MTYLPIRKCQIKLKYMSSICVILDSSTMSKAREWLYICQLFLNRL